MPLIPRIEAAFKQHGARIALSHGETTWTFSDLEDVSRRFASWLLTATECTHVGILVDRTTASYSAFLGTLLAGRTPVPMSATNPALQDMAMLASTDVVIDCRRDTAAPVPVRTIAYSDALAAQNSPAAYVSADPDHAYTLFTSGSTGMPKGVPVKPAALLAYVDAAVDRFEIGPESRLSATFMLTFDVAMHDLFCSLLSGASLHLPVAKEFLTPVDYVSRAELSHWFSVPSVIRLASKLRQLEPGALDFLQVSIFAGEALTATDVRGWHRAVPEGAVYNLYGPTEATIGCFTYRVPDEGPPQTPNGTVPIGKPLLGVEATVRDTRAFTNGASQELLVRGVQRFDGYLGAVTDPPFLDEELANEHISAHHHGEYWYRTGDVVHQLDDGNLVFIGRGDRQVKLNGHRVELGEVEHLVRSLEGVAAALAFVEDDKRLSVAAEYVGSSDGLRKLLRRSLPVHMRPARCLALREFPLNANGKVDHRALQRMGGWA